MTNFSLIKHHLRYFTNHGNLGITAYAIITNAPEAAFPAHSLLSVSVNDIMGHSDYELTANIYTHVIAAINLKIVPPLRSFFRGASFSSLPGDSTPASSALPHEKNPRKAYGTLLELVDYNTGDLKSAIARLQLKYEEREVVIFRVSILITQTSSICGQFHF